MMASCIIQVRQDSCRIDGRFAVMLAFALMCASVANVAVAQGRRSGKSPTAAAPVAQFNGNKIQLPTKRPVSRTSGMTLSVDPRWTNSYGYRPVEVTISSPKATKADHLITIQLHTGWKRSISAEQDFEFSAGSTSATTTIALPTYQANMNNYFWWDVWVDGLKDKDLSIDRVSSLSWMGSPNGNAASLTFLVAGSSSSHRSLVATNAMEFEVLALELAKFPTRWIDYTTLDVVSLSLPEAQQLAQQQPAAFEAIGRWVRAGGQLWISEVGDEFENLPAVSKFFKLSENLEGSDVDLTTGDRSEKSDSTHSDEKAAGKDTKSDSQVASETDALHVANGWHRLRFRRGVPEGQVVTFLDTRTGTRRTIRDPEVIARLRQDPNFVATEERTDSTGAMFGPERKFPPDSSAWFVQQQMGLGTVRAFRGWNEVADFAQSPPTPNPNAVANSDAPDELPRALAMGLRRTERWDARHGMTPDSANVEFVKFLVPGVGLAPVTEFEILITVFVLIIGPLNYWALKRFKRLHLMVLTVPLAATLTTLALFGYAIVADGFATRVRAQSYTTLDQKTGEAACWTRLSYYSGLAPGKGLTMPADMVLYPIQPGWADNVNISEERAVAWNAGEARLTRGWLNSRTPTQYLTVRSRKSPHRLEVLDGGDKVRVTNQLGSKIESLVVVNQSGILFFGEDIADTATAMLQPIERKDAIRRISRLISDSLPQAPPALATNDAELMSLVGRSRYRRYTRYGVQYNAARLSDNLAGDAIANLAGLAGQPALELPPRSYVAITETGPEVETGISYAKEEDSFHLIEGKW